MDFSAPWDRTVRLVTGVVLAVLVGVGVMLYVTFRSVEASDLGLAALELLLLGILLASYLLAPRGYRIEGGALLIRRPIGPVRIPIGRIRRVEKLPPEAIKGAVRTFGNGGLFGFYGRFRNKRLGSFRMYVTDRSRLVLVEADHLYVLSPDRPDMFVETLQARLQT